MFRDLGGFNAAFIVIPIVIYVGLAVLAVYVTYLIIRTAFLRALHSHYKTVRRYEATGEWSPRYQGRARPDDPGRR